MRFFLLLALTLTTAAALIADPPKKGVKEAPPSERLVAEWVEQLADRSFRVRGQAQRSLIGAGPYAMAAVREAAETSKDAEVKRRASEIAKEIEDQAAKRFKEFGADVQHRDDGTVCTVYFRGNKIKPTESDLIQLLALPSLERLALSESKLTDEGLKYVGRLTRLTFLDLSHTSITDAGLVYLKGLDRLEYLNLGPSGVKGSGVVHLKTLVHLKSVGFWRCRIDDEGLKVAVSGLKDLKNLSVIWLAATDITDEGLAHLAALKSLTEISMDETRVTGSGFRHLKALPRLQGLSLRSSRLTDEGCGQLAELKRMVRILPDHTGVTMKGLKKLAALPNLRNISLAGIKLTEAEEAELPKVLPNVVLDGFAEIIRP